MARWVEEAARVGGLDQACRAAGVSLAELADGRRDDPAFDRACRRHDEVVDLRITDALRRQALSGDLRALALYFGRVRESVLGSSSGPASAEGDAPLPAGVAEAMIRAGLEAQGRGGRPSA